VAKIEDDLPNFDDIISPDDMLVSDEALAATETAPQEAQGAEVKGAEPEETPEPEKGKKGKREKAKKAKPEKVKRAVTASDDEFEPEKKPPYAAIGGAIVILAIILVLVFLGYLNFSTALYALGLAIIPLMLWAGRKTSTVYTVILGCVLIALMTSIYLLWCVLARYNFDVKALEAKQQRTTTAQQFDGGLV
jgi:hypothetical protein